ncbi:MAG TPA: hypothetical protein VKS78_04930 [Roseiarcus sp.]|nr:hypothetical protein [Roseiarcus sp.]
MRKILTVLLSSAAIGVGAIATASPASAFVPFLIPLLIGVGAAGVGTGAVIANSTQPTTTVVNEPAPGPAYGPAVAPAPEPGCTVSRQWTGTHWRSVEICH